MFYFYHFTDVIFKKSEKKLLKTPMNVFKKPTSILMLDNQYFSCQQNINICVYHTNIWSMIQLSVVAIYTRKNSKSKIILCRHHIKKLVRIKCDIVITTEIGKFTKFPLCVCSIISSFNYSRSL